MDLFSTIVSVALAIGAWYLRGKQNPIAPNPFPIFPSPTPAPQPVPQPAPMPSDPLSILFQLMQQVLQLRKRQEELEAKIEPPKT